MVVLDRVYADGIAGPHRGCDRAAAVDAGWLGVGRPAKPSTPIRAGGGNCHTAARQFGSGPCRDERKRALRSIAIGMTICVAIAWLVTRSELTPYNVRELVYHGHPFRSMALLVALLYWSVGFPVFIARWLTKGGMYLLSFPLLALLHGLIAWLLIVSAVPTESIHDIVGSPVLGWPWKWELLGRFLALFGAWSVAATAGTIIAATGVLKGARTALLGWAIGAFLVVPVSYYVVVSQASTDNLVELMANNGGVGSFC